MVVITLSCSKKVMCGYVIHFKFSGLLLAICCPHFHQHSSSLVVANNKSGLPCSTCSRHSLLGIEKFEGLFLGKLGGMNVGHLLHLTFFLMLKKFHMISIYSGFNMLICYVFF